MKAELILKNFQTMDVASGAAAVDIIATREAKIIYAGSDNEIESLIDRNTKIFDCGGALVLPGFNDAHCHPFAFAVNLLQADCSEAADIAQMKSCIAKHLDDHDLKAKKAWARAVNCDFDNLAGCCLPEKKHLDEISSSIPIILIDRSGQRCVLNSRALTLCGLDNSSSDTGSSRLQRDSASNELTGLIEGKDVRIGRALPAIADEELRWAVKKMSAHFLSFGITSVQDTSWNNHVFHWTRARALIADGSFVPRLSFMPGYDDVDAFFEAGLLTGYGEDQYRIGAVKIALDESLGNPRPPKELLCDAALRVHKLGFQLAFHVPDIYLLDASMEALRYIRASCPAPPAVRPRFEHCPFCPADLIPEVARSGATLVLQPNFLYEMGERYLNELDEKRWNWIYPVHTFLTNGIKLAMGSDSPMAPCDPLQAIAALVTRRGKGGRRLVPEEGLSVAQAIRAYTCGSAYAARDEGVKGSIVPGMLADMILVHNVESLLEPDSAQDAKVTATFLGGKLVWEEAR